MIEHELQEFARKFGNLSGEERAYLIISNFFESDSMPEEVINNFHDWLLMPCGREDKDKALEKYFMNMKIEPDGETML